eukprot:39826_1
MNKRQRVLGYIKHMTSNTNRSRSRAPTILPNRSLRTFYITAGAMIGATSVAYGLVFHFIGPKILMKDIGYDKEGSEPIDVDETLMQSVRIYNVKERAVDLSTVNVGD